MFGRRILILVPHPDDEVVACSAAIGRAQAQGSDIFALYLTNGCIARETLWPWQRSNYPYYVARRRAEAEKAAKFLDITPVGWSSRPARYLWRDLAKVYTEIQSTILRYSIDQLWVPAYEGGNADHDGLNGIAWLLRKKHRTQGADLGYVKFLFRYLTSPIGHQSSVLEFSEYNFFEGKPRAQEFPFPNGTEQTLKLTFKERQRKYEALAIYKSERRNLNYVQTERECWRPLVDYDYAGPPHLGTVWYARHQWVPFRHPRVDFTRPEEVSAAIVNALRGMDKNSL